MTFFMTSTSERSRGHPHGTSPRLGGGFWGLGCSNGLLESRGSTVDLWVSAWFPQREGTPKLGHFFHFIPRLFLCTGTLSLTKPNETFLIQLSASDRNPTKSPRRVRLCHRTGHSSAWSKRIKYAVGLGREKPPSQQGTTRERYDCSSSAAGCPAQDLIATWGELLYGDTGPLIETLTVAQIRIWPVFLGIQGYIIHNIKGYPWIAGLFKVITLRESPTFFRIETPLVQLGIHHCSTGRWGFSDISETSQGVAPLAQLLCKAMEQELYVYMYIYIYMYIYTYPPETLGFWSHKSA